MQRNKVIVVVTGAAGNIGYATLPRLASGEVFGPNTEVELRLLEITPAMGALEGVAMEMQDCAFPLLSKMVLTDSAEEAFNGVNWAVLVGAKPRGPGMLRGDLILGNGPIFTGQGQALNKAADDARIIVVGNPANTNALIAMSNSDVPNDRFAALTRLDQNRAMSKLATKAGVPLSEVTNVAIWGNHSKTMYPDAENALIGGQPVYDVIPDHEWLKGEFITSIQWRGKAIIDARGKSSAMSAANAALDHIMSVENATPAGDHFAAAIPSDGSYGVAEGIVYSFPLTSDGNGNISIVQGLEISDFGREKMKATEAELLDEKKVVSDAGLL